MAEQVFQTEQDPGQNRSTKGDQLVVCVMSDICAAREGDIQGMTPAAEAILNGLSKGHVVFRNRAEAAHGYGRCLSHVWLGQDRGEASVNRIFVLSHILQKDVMAGQIRHPGCSAQMGEDGQVECDPGRIVLCAGLEAVARFRILKIVEGSLNGAFAILPGNVRHQGTMNRFAHAFPVEPCE